MNYRPILDIVVPAAIVGGAFVILSFVACSSTPVPVQSDDQKGMAADGAYAIDRAACRDKVKYPTVEQSDACAAAERLRWHRLPDGGADGTFADGGAK